MTSLTLLDSVKHAALRVQPNSGVGFARDNHVLPLRAEEIPKASCDFPVFLTRITDSTDWSFSLMASFVVGRNLFVKDHGWDATHLPQFMDTYPFYLMNANEPDQYALAIDESSNAFGEQEGEPLFVEEGKMAPWLTTLTQRLQAQLQSNQQTLAFVKAVEDAGLIKELNLQLMFNDDTANTISGLHTIDEDVLHALDTDTLVDFNKRGYLAPVYAMLHSVFQLNSLIRRHNALAETDDSLKSIVKIKLEMARDAGAAGHVS